MKSDDYDIFVAFGNSMTNNCMEVVYNPQSRRLEKPEKQIMTFNTKFSCVSLTPSFSRFLIEFFEGLNKILCYFKHKHIFLFLYLNYSVNYGIFKCYLIFESHSIHLYIRLFRYSQERSLKQRK